MRVGSATAFGVRCFEFLYFGALVGVGDGVADFLRAVLVVAVAVFQGAGVDHAAVSGEPGKALRVERVAGFFDGRGDVECLLELAAVPQIWLRYS